MSKSSLLSLLCLIFLLGVGNLVAQPFGCHYHDHDFRGDAPHLLDEAQNRAWAARSDSVDILHYDIWLEIPSSGNIIKAITSITLTPKMEGIDTLTFDLAQLVVDSITFEGQLLTFDHPKPYLKVLLPAPILPGDTAEITVYYRGTPLRDPIWGGFYFDEGYAYNLGIGISSNPPNFGRAWYPCFDNFVERATYDIRLLTRGNRRGYAVGDFVSEIQLGSDSILRHYQMNQLLPTYLTNVAVSDYVAHRDTHLGVYGPVPIELLGRPAEFNNMVKAFSRLGDAIDAIEYWYGPYPWSRVGYVMTTAGAMEHPTNTAYPVNAINNGNGDPRLMAHELGHHWWGNITTLREPTDMWIKEGNAEYCAHLMDEWSDGRAAFVNTVKSNHQVVLAQVHQQDGDFLPLSGIPFANIYGRHTYLKGASMLHNMRGYLGDSLFRFGQQSILENYAYQAIDAATYRDHLTLATNHDMSGYFDAWIYEPGFSSFIIQDWNITLQDSIVISLTLRQGLRAAPAYHEQVPLEISLYSSDWEVYRTIVYAGGQISQHHFPVPFEPVHISINESGLLNQARLDYQRIIKATGNFINPFVRFRVNVQAITDSALVRIDHHWVAPEAIIDQPQLKISSTNFWVVSGIFPDGFQAQGRLSYDATAQAAFLDHDIAGINEDSLLLLYRSKPTEPWQEHPDYNIIKFSHFDGLGDVVINGLQPGEYAMARGVFTSVRLDEIALEDKVKLYPNPGNGPLFMEWTANDNYPAYISWYDALGRQVFGQTLPTSTGGILQLETPSASMGLFHLIIQTSKGQVVHKTLLRQ